MDFKKLFSAVNLKKFLSINIGTLIVAVSIHYFLVPSNLAAGGASGFAILLTSVIDIPISIILFVLNSILLILGFITIGMHFSTMTIYVNIIMSVFLRIMETISPMNIPITDDLFINLMFGILISSIGMSVVLNSGGSTGGTDILAKIIEKYTKFSFGNGLIICDGLITLGACFIYGPKLGMYALLGVIMNSFMIDWFIEGFNSKYSITIISEKIDIINNFIIKDLGRGSTIYIAQGGYSSEPRKILNSVMDRKEYIKLHNFVKKIDDRAFLFLSKVSEIEGNGFTYDID
ncbi:MAG: YitT family protein [Peptoanaerobacter stomatis]